MNPTFIYFEESWNEDRTGNVFEGGTSPTGETEDDTKTSSGEE